MRALCKFHPTMTSLLSGAAFMLCILLGSLAEIPTNLSATSSVSVSNVRRVLNETLEVRQPGKLRTVSVIAIHSKQMNPAALFQDQARVEAYAGSEVTAVQYKSLREVGDAPYVPGKAPFEIAHPEGVDERIRIVRLNIEGAFTNPNENQRTKICVRSTFPFAKRSREIQRLASSREVFFNLQVSRATSPRRGTAIHITDTYASEHPEIHVHLSGDTLLHDEWMDLLHQSKFTICPGGHNPETFRMFEALEAGSIPIVSRQDYLDPAYHSPHPCGDGPVAWNTVAASPYAQAVSVDSWEDLPQLLDRLVQMTNDTINQLQVECERWYAALMHGTYASLLHCSSSPKFYPQDGPITPLDLHRM